MALRVAALPSRALLNTVSATTTTTIATTVAKLLPSGADCYVHAWDGILNYLSAPWRSSPFV